MDNNQRKYLEKMTDLLLNSGYSLKALDMMQGNLQKVSIIINDDVEAGVVEHILKDYYFPELIEVTDRYLYSPKYGSGKLLDFTTAHGEERSIHYTSIVDMISNKKPVTILSMTDYGDAKNILNRILIQYPADENVDAENQLVENQSEAITKHNKEDECDISYDHPELESFKKSLPVLLDDLYRRHATNYSEVIAEYHGHDAFVKAIERFIGNKEYIDAILEQLSEMIHDDKFSSTEKKEFKSLFYDLTEYNSLAAAFTACQNNRISKEEV